MSARNMCKNTCVGNVGGKKDYLDRFSQQDVCRFLFTNNYELFPIENQLFHKMYLCIV